MSRDALGGHLAMLAFSALIGGSFSFGGLMANDVSPVVLQAMRFTLAAILVGAAGRATRQIHGADFRAPWRYLLLGGVFSIYFVLMFEGLKTAPPVSASAVMTLMPMMTAGFSFVLLGQRSSPRILAALAVGGIGALWVIFRGDPAALLRFDLGRGEGLYFIGLIAHALYVPLARKLGRGESALAATFGLLVAEVLVLTLWGWRDIRATDFAALPPVVWVALAYLAIGATAVTLVLLNYATMRLPGAKVTAYTYLTPVWVILWELAFGHGLPGAVVLPGVALILLALALLFRAPG